MTSIQCGYQPGLIGRVTQLHATFYAQHAGFGQFFESQVASGLAEFAGRLGAPRNGVWVAMQEEQIVGSVVVDGDAPGDNIALIRWFIVDPQAQGAGLGRQLLSQALQFCDQQGFTCVRLWTFQGLDAARALYEQHGFVLMEESVGEQWGPPVVVQRFERVSP